MADTGLNTLGFIASNSLTYTEIQNDLNTFINALSEDEKLGFKTMFEGTNSKILVELIAAKSSDEIYHIITSRSENLLMYCNRLDSATAIAQNSHYNVGRGSNIKLSITLTPSETRVLSKMEPIAAAEDYEVVIVDDLELTAGQPITFDAYIGEIKEQTLIADSEDLLVFRFTNPNISNQIALYLNGSEVPITTNSLEMLNDKYFVMTNAYGGVDAIYLNKQTNFTHRYMNSSQLTCKYIEFSNIVLNSIELDSYYGTITNVKQLLGTIQPESVSSVRTKAVLYAETQNRIVARDDFAKVFEESNPEILDAVGKDYSNAQVEVTYVKEGGTLLTNEEYQAAYNNLHHRRAYGIPMCLLSHPDIMLNLNIEVVLQLLSGNSALVKDYVRQVLANHEFQLGGIINFSTIENELEGYEFVKTARILPRYTVFKANTLSPEGTIYQPSTPNGKLYVVRNPLFLTGVNPPSWPTQIGAEVEDNDLIWKCEAKSYTNQPLWSAKEPKRINNIIWVDGLNVQFRCIGYTYKTGATEPTWPTERGQFVSDGQILWVSVTKNITAPTWTGNTITEKGMIVNSTVQSSLSYQAINYIPTTPENEPAWTTGDQLFTSDSIQYSVINQTYDPLNTSASNIRLNWNQYVIFNETITVV